jgi:hypothetical protein
MLRQEGDPDMTLEELASEAESLLCEQQIGTNIADCLSATNGLHDELQAMRILSGLGYGVIRPIFRKTDAIGSLMRRKLEPVSTPLVKWIMLLQGRH